MDINSILILNKQYIMKQNIIFLSIALTVFFIVISFSRVPTKNLPNTYNYKNTETKFITKSRSL